MKNISREEEKMLAEGLMKRSRSAMQSFYSLYAGVLFSVCSRYMANDDDAKDVLQDALIKIFTKAENFEYRGKGALLAWSKRVVVMEALDFLRRKNTIPLIYEDNIPELEDDDNLEVEDIPQDVLFRMLQNLPEGYRIVFNLYVLEDKTHKEIGEMLGIKEKSSASQLSRAKKILRQQIDLYKKGGLL
ncbi:MAG: RNA polymerase sigma factor [Prevotella bivia]|nr:RNA polymerase sigma factor [Prevotella bivia]